MSSTHQDGQWGPSHQDRKPPSDRRRRLKLGAVGLFAVGLEVLGERLSREGPLGAAGFTLGTVARGAVIVIGLFVLARALRSGRLRAALRRRELRPPGGPAAPLAGAARPTRAG